MRQGAGDPAAGLGQLRDMAAPARETPRREVPAFRGVAAPIVAAPAGVDAPPPDLAEPAPPAGLGELPDPGASGAGGVNFPPPELSDPGGSGIPARPTQPSRRVVEEPAYLNLPDRIE